VACGAVTAVAGRHAPRQGKVDLKVAGAAVVEPVAHPGGKRELPALQPFLAELPAAPAWSWLGDAGPPVDADHIVDAMCLEPCQEGGAGEAAVGQHDWADPGRQRLQDGGDRMFFEKVARAKPRSASTTGRTPAGSACKTAAIACSSSWFWLASAGIRSRS